MEKLYLSQSTHISSVEMLATETNVFHSLGEGKKREKEKKKGKKIKREEKETVKAVSNKKLFCL